MTDDRAVLVDTNVLLTATAPSRPFYRAAHLVATALTAGVAKLVTANSADFSRFASELEVIELASLD